MLKCCIRAMCWEWECRGTGSERHEEVKPPASSFVVVIFLSSYEKYCAFRILLETGIFKKKLKEVLADILRVFIFLWHLMKLWEFWKMTISNVTSLYWKLAFPFSSRVTFGKL